jgi:uncharacterized membrane protein
MLIPFPIALWVFSLAADLIYFLGGNTAWKDWIAFHALAGGSAAAAVFGIIDWLSIKDRAVKRTADWHARLNVIALLIFAASFYLRTTGGSDWTGGSTTISIALSVVGVILTFDERASASSPQLRANMNRNWLLIFAGGMLCTGLATMQDYTRWMRASGLQLLKACDITQHLKETRARCEEVIRRRKSGR